MAEGEQAKYEKVWAHERYRRVAPGEQAAAVFQQVAKPERDKWCIDFGAGTGRGSLMLRALCGLRVHMLDFAGNCLDKGVRAALADSEHFRFTQHDLTKPCPTKAEYGYCTDVMEHIPPEDVDVVLKNILAAARHVFFHISCAPDKLGKLIGEPLHLTVQPYAWWKERLQKAGCAIRWSKDLKHSCCFYVTRWANGRDIKQHSKVNTEDDEIAANVRANLDLQLPEIKPHEQQDTEILLVAGGPSLNQYEDDIKARRAAGMPLVTVNGAYNWCIERNIHPSAQIVLDAREFNKRFVLPVLPKCKYLLASQCHPDTVKQVPRDQVLLWHSGEHLQEVILAYDQERGISREWFPVPGGMTVVMRAFPLLIMLGFSRFHVYGLDSCIMDGEHHAYAQAENDSDKIATVKLTGSEREFFCHGWMITQAQEFIDIQRMIADVCQMKVYGDGLIAHIIETGARLATTITTKEAKDGRFSLDNL